MAYLALMLEGREDVSAPQQLEVRVGAVAADLFEQILEANHARRCLTFQEGRRQKAKVRLPRPMIGAGVARGQETALYFASYGTINGSDGVQAFRAGRPSCQ